MHISAGARRDSDSAVHHIGRGSWSDLKGLGCQGGVKLAFKKELHHRETSPPPPSPPPKCRLVLLVLLVLLAAGAAGSSVYCWQYGSTS
jgi:hypothetical protein